MSVTGAPVRLRSGKIVRDSRERDCVTQHHPDASYDAPRVDPKPVKGYRSEEPRPDRGQRYGEPTRDDRPRSERGDRPYVGNNRNDRDERTGGERPRFDRDDRPQFRGDRDNRSDRPYTRNERDERPSFRGDRDNRQFTRN